MRILAASVNDLTVARYFAAMGVDVMAFDYSFDRIARIKEIMEWLSGPKVAVQINQILPQEEHDILCHSLQPDLLICSPEQTFTCHLPIWPLFHLSDTLTFDSGCIITVDGSSDELTDEEIEKIESLDNRQNVFLDFVSPGERDIIFAADCELGIVLRGGNESKTGIMSFDELDNIFDFIETEIRS